MNTATSIIRNNPVFLGAATQCAEAPTSIIEQRIGRLGRSVTDLDEAIGNTIDRLAPLSVLYPAPPDGKAQNVPKEMQCEYAARLENLAEHVEALTARLLTALNNVQI